MAATDATDSDAIANGGRYEIVFTMGSVVRSNDTFDFGLVNNLYIGDLLWWDVDADGVRGPGDLVINNATEVNIVAEATPLITRATYTTATDGIYFFGDGLDQTTRYLM